MPLFTLEPELFSNLKGTCSLNHKKPVQRHYTNKCGVSISFGVHCKELKAESIFTSMAIIPMHFPLETSSLISSGVSVNG
jgi:hypothetical protein